MLIAVTEWYAKFCTERHILRVIFSTYLGVAIFAAAAFFQGVLHVRVLMDGHRCWHQQM